MRSENDCNGAGLGSASKMFSRFYTMCTPISTMYNNKDSQNALLKMRSSLRLETSLNAFSQDLEDFLRQKLCLFLTSRNEASINERGKLLPLQESPAHG